MPAKINVTSHISLHTWSRSHEVLPKSWRSGNYTGYWPSGWQQKHLWSKHPLQSNLQSI